MSSDKNTITAWAIAVSTIPILQDLHREQRCWKKGEDIVPEYLYFDVLLRANEKTTSNPTLHQVAYQICRRVEWILQQRQVEKVPDVTEILTHLCSPQFFDWMAKCFWGGKDEVDEDVCLGCTPLYCHGVHDSVAWLEQCPQKTPCIENRLGDYGSPGFYNCDWCGWYNSQLCLTCFDQLISDHPSPSITLQEEVQWIHELIKQGEINLTLHLPELAERAVIGNQKSCVQFDRLFIMKFGHHPDSPYWKTFDQKQLIFPEKYTCEPSYCPQT